MNEEEINAMNYFECQMSWFDQYEIDIEKLKTIIQLVKRQNRELKIKQEFLKLIRDLLYDYDGYYDETTKKGNIEGLVSLIDEVAELVIAGIRSDDKSCIYENAEGVEKNILLEDI